MNSRESIDFHSIIDVDRDGDQEDPSVADTELVDSTEGDQEIEGEQELSVERPNSNLTVSSLSAADFQRIGLHPRETRLTVIRRAASRTARALASLQLSSPSLATEQKLYQVALSTYRLLDPRQRSDRQSRAHVGRIRPGVLQSAGRAWFSEKQETNSQRSADNEIANAAGKIHASEAVSEKTVGEKTASDLSSSNAATEIDRVVDYATTSPIQRMASESSIDLPPVVDQAFEAPFVPSGSHESIWDRLRYQFQRPGAVMLLIVVLILAAIGVWYWGHSMSQLPRSRFNER